MSHASATLPEPCGVALDARLAEVTALCLDTLASEFAGFTERVPSPCHTPEQWFAELRKAPSSKVAVEILARMRDTAAAPGMPRPFGGAVRHALLQAMLAALPRVPALPVEPFVKHLCCDMFTLIARPKPQWEDHFHETHWRFVELVKLVTLRRLPAGQHDWVIDGLPRSWLLGIPLPKWPGLLWEVAQGFGAFSPLAAIHHNPWRANPLILGSEANRSVWLIAKSLQRQPEVRGLIGRSWFYSSVVSEVSPHLAWLRGFFVENGAYVVEMEEAKPNAGFLIGSTRRRKLYEEGKFRPRVTLVLWRRADMLAWADAHPEFAP
ncbi:MAG: hypothetical protein K2Q10_04155, partial [Rhodospirillales bacterium]|nr:hypothetical protein [Rhodospirillales bacterium]